MDGPLSSKKHTQKVLSTYALLKKKVLNGEDSDGDGEDSKDDSIWMARREADTISHSLIPNPTEAPVETPERSGSTFEPLEITNSSSDDELLDLIGGAPTSTRKGKGKARGKGKGN